MANVNQSASPVDRFFDHCPDLICVVGPDGAVAQVSASLAKLGYAAPEVIGRPFLGFVHPDDAAATAAALAEPVIAFEHRFQSKDGSYRHLSWTGARDAAGTVYATARAHPGGVEATRQASQFLDAIIENIPHMVFLKDAATLSFARFNRAGEELLGLSRANLLGKNDFDLFPVDEAVAFQAKDRETLNGKTLVEIPEEPIETKRGRRWLRTKKVPLLDERGTPTFLLGISEDITELKALTEARQRFQEALEHEKNAAQAANKELEAFSYSVAHDLRAPLRSIDGFSRLLLDDHQAALDDTGKRYLAMVRTSAQRMGQLIDDLLTLSRVTRSELHRERLDLTVTARAVVEHLRAASPERSVEVVVPPELPAHGDPRLLAVVMENLLGNAWKFTGKREGARIELSTSAGEGGVVYVIRDNGAGFDQAFAGKLFGAFQRLHAVTEFDGTGIGLATVRRIVTRHGGRVWAEGKVGEGATFYFTLGGSEIAS